MHGSHGESAGGKTCSEQGDGILKPDDSENNQNRPTSASSAEDTIKVDVTLAPGLQVKDPSRRPKSATSLDVDVFRNSAASVLLPAMWAKLPHSLVLRGEDRGWKKIINETMQGRFDRKGTEDL